MHATATALSNHFQPFHSRRSHCNAFSSASNVTSNNTTILVPRQWSLLTHRHNKTNTLDYRKSAHLSVHINAAQSKPCQMLQTPTTTTTTTIENNTLQQSHLCITGSRDKRANRDSNSIEVLSAPSNTTDPDDNYESSHIRRHPLRSSKCNHTLTRTHPHSIPFCQR